jgi:uncharacterized protein
VERLEKYRPEIEALCKIYKVKTLYAFGSVLTERFTDESDIDLIVDFLDIEVEDYADNYFDFKFALQDSFGRRVDLLESQRIADTYFQKTISEKILLVYPHTC